MASLDHLYFGRFGFGHVADVAIGKISAGTLFRAAATDRAELVGLLHFYDLVAVFLHYINAVRIFDGD